MTASSQKLGRQYILKDMEHDILLVDKPSGITSFDVIRILRRQLGVRKMGHAGTLDPLASGLLLVAIGDATKKLTDLLKLPKEYETTVRLGVRTDTGDTTGHTIEETPVPDVPADRVRDALQEMIGTLDLPVPAYSAVKQRGRPLYERARRGEEMRTPIRPMQILAAELLDMSGPDLHIRWEVGSGTYIRSLAEELGRRLGTIATVAALRRTRIGDFSVADAQAPDIISSSRR
jgi:tRNA pseudouridine55 synthase